MICEYCLDLDDMEGEYPGEAHEGMSIVCGECDSDYYEEYGGTQYACNEQAQKNHPELKTL